MTICEILTNLAINLFAGVLIFLLGIFWPAIPKSCKKVLLRRFWGKHVIGDDILISYGTIKDSRLFQPNQDPFRFVKQYRDGRAIKLVGPFGNIVGDCEIRSASYVINALSTFRRKAITVLDDTSAFKNLNRTIISFGSPSSNEISDIIMREPNNIFLEFRQENGTSFILEKITNQRFEGFQGPIKKDYGIVLKIQNSRFPEHFLIMCAGLGEWGTSGAAWYLSSNWQRLQKLGKEFGVIVEVVIGSDESSRMVFPANR